MIDIESLEYTRVKAAVSALYPSCNFGTTSSDTPASFPFLLFSQKDNPVYQRTIDSGSRENHVQPMIQIDTYSSSTMYEAKQIIAAADAQMQTDGFTRTYGPYPTSMTKPYRLTARYQGIVRSDGSNEFTVFGIS